MIYFFAPTTQIEYLKDYNINYESIYNDINDFNMGKGFKENDTLVFTFIKEKIFNFNFYDMIKQVTYHYDSRGIVLYTPRIQTLTGHLIYDVTKFTKCYPLETTPIIANDLTSIYTQEYTPIFLFGALMFDNELKQYLYKRKQHNIFDMLFKYLTKYPEKKLFDGNNVIKYDFNGYPEEIYKRELKLRKKGD